MQSQHRGAFQPKVLSPCRIRIKKLAGRAERGNHLAGVLEKIAVSLLRLALCLLALRNGALFHGYGHHACELGRGAAKCRDVQCDRDDCAVFVEHLRIEAGHHAGRQHAHAGQVRGHAPRRRRVRRPAYVTELLDLRYQPLALSRRQDCGLAPQLRQLRGTVAQQPFRGGIRVEQLAVEIHGHNRRSRRVE